MHFQGIKKIQQESPFIKANFKKHVSFLLAKVPST